MHVGLFVMHVNLCSRALLAIQALSFQLHGVFLSLWSPLYTIGMLPIVIMFFPDDINKVNVMCAHFKVFDNFVAS